MIYNSKYYNSNHIDKSDNELSNVVVYGTGTLGALAIHALKNRNIKIQYVVDDNVKNWNKEFLGYDIKSPKIFNELNPDNCVIIASLRYKYMLSVLNSFNINSYLHCNFLFNELDLNYFKHTVNRIEGNTDIKHIINVLDQYMYSIYSYREKLLNIKSLDIVVTEACTLKCKDCANLMQYYEKPHHADDADLLDSFNKFINVVDDLLEARILGGEPLMYKNIKNILEILTKNSKVKNIVIFTNGTIIPKDLDIFTNSKIFIKISDYGKNSKHSKIPELENLLTKKGIKFLTERVVTWQNAASIGFHKRSIDQTKQIFGTCCVNDSLTMLNGYLYLCPFSAHVDNLKAVPHYPNDIINFKTDNQDEIYTKLFSFIYEKEFIKACNFCEGRDYTVGDVEAGVQVKSPIKYEKYDSI